MLDCVDIGFIADGVLEELTGPSQIGATRVGGVDLNQQRARNALSAVLALTPAPKGFTSAGFAAKVRCMTGQTDAEYTIRQAAYDLRKLRGKGLIELPARTRRYHVPPQAARTVAALLTLRDHVIAPSPPSAGGAQTGEPDRHRPRLRKAPHRHGEPLRPPRHLAATPARGHCIDNVLSM